MYFSLSLCTCASKCLQVCQIYIYIIYIYIYYIYIFLQWCASLLGGLGSLVGIRIRNSEDFPKVPDQAVRTLRMRSSSSNWTHPLSTFACRSCRRVRICRTWLGSQKYWIQIDSDSVYSSKDWEGNGGMISGLLFFFQNTSGLEVTDSLHDP